MNNVSATSSTEFIQHHISKFSVLRPLTMVLKQWLFQRKMNEVYSRGGLSSYALFLLVLTVIHEHKFESSEALGRYLVQFLRQWGSPTAFSDIIRPLHGYLDKSVLNWKDPYQPFSLCTSIHYFLMKGIQDPVNEHNCIGRQTFSIRDIQQEWQLSLNALSAAIDEYERNINGGREKSILASIVGLTTRYVYLGFSDVGNMKAENKLIAFRFQKLVLHHDQ
jgi:non-canonical poly(A) RNA polymerase PAPD5/7